MRYVHKAFAIVFLASVASAGCEGKQTGRNATSGPVQSAASNQSNGEKMSTYKIVKAQGSVPLVGEVTGPWAKANVLQVENHPWYKGGQKQGTAVRVMYDDQAVYLQFICQDKHSFSKETRFNGDVYLDSTVEFFASIDPAKKPDYFNLEINCCGVMHVGFGPGRHDRKLMSEALGKRITVVRSIQTATKEESAADNGWFLAVKVPFDVISEFAGEKVKPAKGTIWKANFYRCGGKTDTQHACWNMIGVPTPDFHRPEYFGELTFE